MSRSGEIHSTRVWKRFRADRRYSRLRDEFERLTKRRKGTEEQVKYRWALQDVSVSVEPGDSMALVGANGSGKSTLLKILTRVMYPYAGSVDVTGRVGAMIEVRSGIHPDLSGRENVFLYGRLLGLTRKQVADRFEEIVEFAELGSAIDRQVKHYSSGMQMRLGFAVAAYLEPDVLLVDEVLAVGDARFQQRCLDRMRKVLQGGTTLVFVSHDLTAVEAMCKHSTWMDNGIVRDQGPTRQVLAGYRQAVEQDAEVAVDDSIVRIAKLQVHGPDHGAPRTHEDLDVRLVFETQEEHFASMFVGISEGPATSIFLLHNEVLLANGFTEVRCRMRDLPLPQGRYFLWVGLFDGHEPLLDWHPCSTLDVEGPDLDVPPRAIVRLAPIHVAASFESAATDAPTLSS
jgi:ABC-2 type transport system ATP-binding protein